MRDIARRHKIALLIAVIVGIISVAPSIIAPLEAGTSYRSGQYLPLDDEDIYRARIHEILDGHLAVASAFLYEYKDAQAVLYPVNEWIYAIPSFVFGLSSIIVASKFLLPALLFLLAYAFMYALLPEEDPNSVYTAIAVGLLVWVGNDLIDYGYLATLLHGGPPRPILWTRIVNPIIGGVELFGFLYLLWQVWRGQKYAEIAAGVVLALTVGYFFSFGLSLALLATLFVFALLTKKHGVAQRLCVAGAVSVVFDSWWWYGTLTSVGGPAGRALAMRNGMFFTHTPVVNKFLLVATIIVGVCFVAAYVRKIHREHSDAWIFVWAMLLASWMAFNQQILTGREIWYQHFVQYTVPLEIVCMLAALALVRPLFPRLHRVGLVALCAIALLYGAYSIRSVSANAPNFVVEQGYGSLMNWLNENAPKDCVVLEIPFNEQLERLVPGNSRCNVYTTTWTFSGVTPERVEHNFLLRMRLSGVAASGAHSYLASHEDDIRQFFFGDWDQMFGHGDEPWIDARIAVLEKDYGAFAQRPLEAEIKRYRVDYIVSDHALSPSLLGALPDLELASTTGVLYVYSFRSDME